MFPGSASLCGVAIYVRQELPMDYCDLMKDVACRESVWCDLRNDEERLLIGAVYISPSSNRDNHNKLN